MLAERVMKNPRSIKVLPGPEGKYELYYGTFTLRDDPKAEPDLQALTYWELPEAYEKTIDRDCFVYIAEKKDGKTVDSCRFFFNCGGSGRKMSLSWSIEKMGVLRRFEQGAHEIIIRWNNSNGEPIRSEYIFLYPKNRPDEQYQFLTDYVKPSETDGNDAIDRYVFFPGDGQGADDFKIGFAPIVQEKYYTRN